MNPVNRRQRNYKISDNFWIDEFRCKCCGTVTYHLDLVTILQDIRDHFKAKVTLNSAYRCLKHNEAVGGTKRSQHLKGRAADIVIEGVSPQEVYDYLDTKYPCKYGLGLYNTFVHIDVRYSYARW